MHTRKRAQSSSFPAPPAGATSATAPPPLVETGSALERPGSGTPTNFCEGTYMVKGGEIGGFGGGWLEHPRQWLGTQWAGLFLGVLSCPEPPGAP